MQRLRRFVKSERGTQLAELAIMLPIFLMLFGAVAEFGRFYYTYTTLAKGTRIGARYLINQPVNVKDEEAKRLVVCGSKSACTGTDGIVKGLSTTQVKITRTGDVATVPETVTVGIEGYYYEPVFDLGKLTGNPSLSLKIQVRPSTTMRFLLTTPSV